MTTSDKVSEACAEFDGRDTEPLERCHDEMSARPDYFDALCAAVGVQQVAATWLLKRLFEKGYSPDKTETGKHLDRLNVITNWEAQLHVCQSVRYLDLPSSQTEQLADWLAPLLRHKRPFLRAWSLDALVHMSKADKTYRSAAEIALANAEQDEAASVRARARNLAL